MALLLLILLVLALGSGLFFALRRAEALHLLPVGLLILTAPLEVYRTSAGSFNLSVFRLAIAAALAITVVRFIRGSRRVVFIPAVYLIYGGLLAVQVASLLFVSPHTSLGYRFFSQYVAGLLVAFIVIQTVKPDDGRVLVGLYVAAGFLPLLAGVWRIFSVTSGGSGNLPGLSILPLDPSIEAARRGGSYLLDGTLRMQATFSDPNHYGFYIGTVMVLAVAGLTLTWLGASTGRSVVIAAYSLLAIAGAGAVVGSYSRSAWLLSGVALLLGCALAGRVVWTRRRAVAAGIAGVVAVAALAPLLAARLFSTAEGAAASNQTHASTARLAVNLFEAHPFTGVGLGDYGPHAGQPPLVSSAHSTFLTVAAELGLPGLLFLLAAMIFVSAFAIRSALHAKGAKRIIQLGFSASFVGLVVANAVYEVWMDDFQWVLFGCLLALTAQPGWLLSRSGIVVRPLGSAAPSPPETGTPDRPAPVRVAFAVLAAELAICVLAAVAVARIDRQPAQRLVTTRSVVTGRDPYGDAYAAMATVADPLPHIRPLQGSWHRLEASRGYVSVDLHSVAGGFFDLGLVAQAPHNVRLGILTSAGQRGIALLRANILTPIEFGPFRLPRAPRVDIKLYTTALNSSRPSGTAVISPIEAAHLAPGEAVLRMSALAVRGPNGVSGIILPTGSAGSVVLTPGIHGRCVVRLQASTLGSAVVRLTVKIKHVTRAGVLRPGRHQLVIGPFPAAAPTLTLAVSSPTHASASIIFGAAHVEPTR